MPAQSLELSASPSTSFDGVIALSWPAAAGEDVELQRASTPGFDDPRGIYKGSDEASVVTGLGDGDYYFRIRTADANEPWSSPVRVTVQHHSLTRAFGFLSLGAVVFLATALLIFLGGRKP